MKTASEFKSMAQDEGAVTSGIHSFTISALYHINVSTECVRERSGKSKNKRGNKNQSELVMAVMKYCRGFYLQPVIKLPLPEFMEMLAPQSYTLFAKGMLITSIVHSEYIGRWTFCLIEHCKLEIRC